MSSEDEITIDHVIDAIYEGPRNITKLLYPAIRNAITQARREVVEKVMRLIDEFHAQQAGGMDYNQGLIDGQQALAVYIMNGLTDYDLKAKERDGK